MVGDCPSGSLSPLCWQTMSSCCSTGDAVIVNVGAAGARLSTGTVRVTVSEAPPASR